jgi:hypothetical protein
MEKRFQVHLRPFEYWMQAMGVSVVKRPCYDVVLLLLRSPPTA